jgi:FkbM family methyltransferase
MRSISKEPLQLKIAVRGQPLQLFLSERDFVSDIIRRDLYWEMPQTILLSKRVKNTDTILDIGANLGYYTVLGAKLAPEGVVHAFEPDPENYSLLQRNCELNNCRNVVLHNMALSNHRGQATLFRSRHNAGDHRLSDLEGHDAGIAVQIETADAILADLPRADIIKCDTQGAEAAVMEGLSSLMARSNPKPLGIVEFEPLGLAAMGSSAAALLDQFDAWRYRYSFVNWENIFPIDRDALLAIAKHWIETKSPGNLDLVLSPK